jgi:hypothetical protein
VVAVAGGWPATYNRDMKPFAEFFSHHPPQALRPFSETTTERGLKLLFSVGRSKESLDFSFVLNARAPKDVANLVIPNIVESSARRRRDELWKSTCLEIFVGSAQSSSYIELNLSPSGDWNAYFFENYRLGMRPVADAHPPLLKFENAVSGDALSWHACLRSSDGNGSDHGEVVKLLGSGPLVMGASCVLEYKSGEREYWALVHAGEKPDFHLRESFRLPL